MAAAGAHPAFGADDHRHSFVNHFEFGDGFFLSLNQRAAWVFGDVTVLLGVGLDLFDHQAAQCRGVAQNLFQLALLFAQFFQFAFDLDGFQARELAQANVQDIFSLAVT